MNELRLASDIVMLGLVDWREARGESFTCKVAVAHSIMNRVHRPSWWGKTLLEVLFKKWQYSSVTDPKDPQLVKWPTQYDEAWLECLEASKGVLLNHLENPAPGADSYYDISIDPPKWADPAKFVVQIDRIRFYNLDSDYQEEKLNV
jgi:spore germination cell wall hydrolase CwlJ-like protein